MSNLLRVLGVLCLVFSLTGDCSAVEIKGTVVETTGTTAVVKASSDDVPDVGDSVEIYFEIPGLDEKATVATGKVSKAGNGMIDVQIEKTHTKITKGQLARIKSNSTRKGTAASPQVLICPSARNGNSEILVFNADGTATKALTSNRSNNTYPAWSPDGRHIVFSSSDQSGGGLFVMDADGGNVKRLTTGTDVGTTWSPDGRRIAFTRYLEGSPNLSLTQIVTLTLDGGPQLNASDRVAALTDGSAYDADPAWSPDGARLAFASNRGGGGFRLYTMNADGGNVRDVSQSDNPGGHVYPAWSPSGKQIVYTDLAADGRRQLFVADADGNHKSQLTKQGALDTFAAWSPDARQIAFMSFDTLGEKGSLYVINADGTNAHVILRNEGPAFGSRPAWKPR